MRSSNANSTRNSNSSGKGSSMGNASTSTRASSEFSNTVNDNYDRTPSRKKIDNILKHAISPLNSTKVRSQDYEDHLTEVTDLQSKQKFANPSTHNASHSMPTNQLYTPQAKQSDKDQKLTIRSCSVKLPRIINRIMSPVLTLVNCIKYITSRWLLDLLPATCNNSNNNLCIGVNFRNHCNHNHNHNPKHTVNLINSRHHSITNCIIWQIMHQDIWTHRQLHLIILNIYPTPFHKSTKLNGSSHLDNNYMYPLR